MLRVETKMTWVETENQYLSSKVNAFTHSVPIYFRKVSEKH